MHSQQAVPGRNAALRKMLLILLPSFCCQRATMIARAIRENEANEAPAERDLAETHDLPVLTNHSGFKRHAQLRCGLADTVEGHR